MRRGKWTWGALLLGGIGALAVQAQPTWSGLSVGQEREFRLVADVRADVELVHHAYLGILPEQGSLDAVVSVRYTFLQEPLASPERWMAGAGDASGGNRDFPGHDEDDHDPHASYQTEEVRERGSGGEGPAFPLKYGLFWPPRQVLAAVTVRERGGRLREVRLEPVTFELPDPSLDVVMKAEYAPGLTPSPEGLLTLPQIRTVKFRFRRHPERPEAVEKVREVAVGVGRTGHAQGALPRFERYSLEEIRANEGLLEIGSISSRRQMGTMAYGDRRDFLWIQVVDVDGRTESYGAWRPSYLGSQLTTAARERARAPERLEPVFRALPEEGGRE